MKTLDRYGSAFLRALVRQMRALGLNQSALARRMNVSRAYVSKVFTGNAKFTFESAAHFAKALGMDFIPGLAEHKDDTSPSHSNSSLQLSPSTSPSHSNSSLQLSPSHSNSSLQLSPTPTPTRPSKSTSPQPLPNVRKTRKQKEEYK